MPSAQGKHSRVVSFYTILAVVTLVPACAYWWAQYLGYYPSLDLGVSPGLVLTLVTLGTLPLPQAVLAVSCGDHSPDLAVYTWFVLLAGVNMTLSGVALEAVGASSRTHDTVSRMLLTWNLIYILMNHFYIPGTGMFWSIHAYNRRTVVNAQVIFCTVPHLIVAVACLGTWVDQYIPYKLAPVLATIAVSVYCTRGVLAWYALPDEAALAQREMEIYAEMRRQSMIKE